VHSDIYALGATLYYLFTKHTPPESTVLASGTILIPPRQINNTISPNTETVILTAMKLNANQRYVSVQAMEQALIAVPPTVPVAPLPQPQSDWQKKSLVIFGLLILFFLSCGLVLLFFTNSDWIRIALFRATPSIAVTVTPTYAPPTMPTSTTTLQSIVPTTPVPTTPRPMDTPTPTVTRVTPTFTSIPALRLALDLASPIAGKVATNNASGFNQISISAPFDRNGTKALRLSYTIKGDLQNNYVGVNICFDQRKNWTGYSALAVWVENDSYAKDVVVQFGERQCPTGGFIYFADEVWKRNISLVSFDKGLVTIPFNTFRWAKEFSPAGNGRIDIDTVAYLGLYIEAPRNATGEVYFGQLYLVP
jgi:hypothetical protein